MKHIIVLLTMSTVLNAESQCLPGTFTFSSLLSIENFVSGNPECTQILGSTTISGVDITNMKGLNGITSIGGSESRLQLTIADCYGRWIAQNEIIDAEIDLSTQPDGIYYFSNRKEQNEIMLKALKINR